MLRTRGADIIAYPSAFTARTGAAHWETLLRCRAIETQTYVIGAAAVGQHVENRVSWGHAMVWTPLFCCSLLIGTQIVDPWGTVLAECSDIGMGKPAFCVADIDLENLHSVRTQLPVEKHRRNDVYNGGSGSRGKPS